VSEKKYLQCQIIYVTSQDKKDVVSVIVIFTPKTVLVLVVLQDLGQNLETKEYGNKVDLQWNMSLMEIILGS
jgi:hypothetical protein